MANNLTSAVDEVIIGTEYIKCCIYKVPKNLRKVNEEAYTPQLISIGPYHHGKRELVGMEDHKKRYMKEFYQRITPDKMNEIKAFIEIHIEKIQRHYADPNELPTNEFDPYEYDPSEFTTNKFANIILLDAIFIVELFLRFERGDRSDFLLNELWLGPIRRDLQLLENQVPYFVLEELYKLVVSSSITQDLKLPISFSRSSSIFFQLFRWSNRPLHIVPLHVKIRHFTDLCRYALVQIPPYPKYRGITLCGLPNAVRLKRSGVKFKLRSGKYLVDIILENRKPPLSFTNVVELKIPRIEITDNTESLIRNVMGLEQCHYPSETYLCSYIELMNFLIKTENDVNLLVEEGIILNYVGDNAVIASMFNKLCLQIPPSRYSYYSNYYNDLRIHCNSRWNRAKELFRLVYVKIATAFVLFTVIQIVVSVLQTFLPGSK